MIWTGVSFFFLLLGASGPWLASSVPMLTNDWSRWYLIAGAVFLIRNEIKIWDLPILLLSFLPFSWAIPLVPVVLLLRMFFLNKAELILNPVSVAGLVSVSVVSATMSVVGWGQHSDALLFFLNLSLVFACASFAGTALPFVVSVLLIPSQGYGLSLSTEAWIGLFFLAVGLFSLNLRWSKVLLLVCLLFLVSGLGARHWAIVASPFLFVLGAPRQKSKLWFLVALGPIVIVSLVYQQVASAITALSVPLVVSMLSVQRSNSPVAENLNRKVFDLITLFLGSFGVFYWTGLLVLPAGDEAWLAVAIWFSIASAAGLFWVFFVESRTALLSRRVRIFLDAFTLRPVFILWHEFVFKTLNGGKG